MRDKLTAHWPMNDDVDARMPLGGVPDIEEEPSIRGHGEDSRSPERLSRLTRYFSDTEITPAPQLEPIPITANQKPWTHHVWKGPDVGHVVALGTRGPSDQQDGGVNKTCPGLQPCSLGRADIENLEEGKTRKSVHWRSSRSIVLLTGSSMRNLRNESRHIRARSRWSMAIRKIRFRVAMKNILLPRLRQAFMQLIRALVCEVGMVALISIFHVVIEGSELSDKFGEDLTASGWSSFSQSWFIAFYMYEIASMRVGLGDVIPVTDSGRWFMIATVSMSAFGEIFLQIAAHGVLTECLSILERLLSEKPIPWFRDSTCAVAYLAWLAFTGWFWMRIANHHGNTPLSWLDGIWLSWQHSTTVGYGDSILDVGYFTLPTFILARLTTKVGHSLLNYLLVSAIPHCDKLLSMSSVWNGEDEGRASSSPHDDDEDYGLTLEDVQQSLPALFPVQKSAC